jgi:CDP-glucose 4,6-dehydratase
MTGTDRPRIAIGLSSKRVLLTGHTGFIGSWFVKVLAQAGIRAHGYSLRFPTRPSMFRTLSLDTECESEFGDVLDFRLLRRFVHRAKPEVVIHLAAQPIVIDSYHEPRETIESNLLGTVNLLDALRNEKSVKAIVVFTTDKVYADRGQNRPYRESDRLGGYDPYSASKAMVELAVNAYYRSFFRGGGVGVATVRAANVIGGGDWGRYRLVPTLVDAIVRDRPAVIRNPRAVRPWQFVLEPISGTLTLLEKLVREPSRFSGSWNFGPTTDERFTVLELARKLVARFGRGTIRVQQEAFHESGILALDSRRATAQLGWSSVYPLDSAVDRTVDWYRAYYDGHEDMNRFTESQVVEYFVRQSELPHRRRAEDPA